jgi:hypothetical protein
MAEGEQEHIEMADIEDNKTVTLTVPRRQESVVSGNWYLMGRPFPRSEVKYMAQVLILYIVILTSLGNLSVGNSELRSIWISLLSSSIGYILPSPHISKKRHD